MSNRLFQGIVHQMSDSIDRVIGVIDDTATIVACSDLSRIGESVNLDFTELSHAQEPVVYNGFTFLPFGNESYCEYAVMVEGDDTQAAKYISLSKSNVSLSTRIIELADKRFEVTIGAKDKHGKGFSLSLAVNSKSEALRIVEHFEKDPDSIHRGILFCVSGKLEFLS